jgi:hypothetical protein
MSYSDGTSEGVIARVLKLLESEFQHMRKERAALDNVRAAISQRPFISTQKVKLDVGGKLFATTIHTLTTIPDCYFGTTFSGRWEIELDSDGTFFIDRDPSAFHHILNFLRDYPNTTIRKELLTPYELHMLTQEAEFYTIQPLMELLAVPVASSTVSGLTKSEQIEFEINTCELVDLFGEDDEL